MKPRVTLRDIAEAAGLSLGAVSMALRHDHRISAETVERVRLQAEKMGYRPDPAMQLLTARRWKRSEDLQGLSLVLLTSSASLWPSWRRFHLALIKKQVAESGYGFEEIHLAGKPPGAVQELLWKRGIRGVLLGPILSEHTSLLPDFSKIAAVNFACLDIPFSAPTIGYDTMEALLMSLRRIAEKGYQRIGLACAMSTPSYDRVMKQAAVLASRMELPRSIRFLPHYYTEEEPNEKLEKWIQKQNPDAIIGWEQKQMVWLQNMGCRVPQDFGYAALYKTSDDPKLAGMRYPTESIVKAAVNWLDGQIQRNEAATDHIHSKMLIAPVWQDGRTLPLL